MSVTGMQELKIREFGGLNTLTDATNLPVWASPDCQDVEFYPGLVKSRPGTSSVFATLAGNPTVNYLKTFVTPTLAQRLLALDSLGNLYKENPTGTLALISNQILANNYANSVSIFGREYIAFSDGKIGTDIPRQYDDTNLDRISQIGPGLAPSPTDEINSINIVASPNGALAYTGTIAAGPSGLIQNGFVVTVVLTASNTALSNVLGKIGDPVKIIGAGAYNGTFVISAIVVTNPSGTTFQYVHTISGLAPSGGGTAQFSIGAIMVTPATSGLQIGQNVAIIGVGVAAYNGTFVIRGIGSVSGVPAYFIFFGSIIFAAANSGNGTINASGNIGAGVHQISVMFQTRQGYITKPSLLNSWTAVGGKRVIVANIPIGPPNIVARIIAFTAAGGNNFFYLPGNPSILPSSNMVIQDNITTAATFDFTDELLLSGVSADSLFNLLELGECSGIIAYSSRLFAWGEVNKIDNFTNLSFDGGFSNPGSLPNFPLGWTPDSVFSPGGASALVQGQPVVWGDAYEIVGNGSTPTRGLITQSAATDSLNVAILSTAIQYSIRARIRGNRALTQGTLHINLFSTSASINTTGLTLTAAQTTTTYVEYTAVLGGPFTSIPNDLLLQIFADGTPILNDAWLIDCIEIFPTNQPYNNSQIKASFVENPESFDSITGFLNVAPENGQAVRSCFVIRNNLYIAKERSLWVTQDDGTNEPSFWSIQDISQKVGTPSVRGVGVGDEWAIIAGVDGVYYFAGSPPQKISQEIQPTWNNINWTYGHLITVTVDTKRKRVYIAVPYGSSTTPNKILTLDYTQGFQEPQDGIGRKWSPWALSVNSMNLILRPDNTQKLFLGNGAATGKIYQLDDSNTVFNDDGAVINAYWQPGYFQDGTRLNYGYVIANVVGSGTCNLTLKRGDQSSIIPIRGWIMSLLGYTNMERQIQKQAYRMSMIFGVNTLNSYFSLQGFSMWASPAIYGPVRGINS